MKAVARLCCSAIAVLLLSSLALSQSLTTGAINGTILDSSGAAISGATIVATNTNTGAKRTTTSGDTGLFVLAQLDPGEYTVTAQAQGFKTGQSGAVTVSVSRIASFHFRLQVGAISEKVEVSTQVPLIEPSNPNTTTTFDAKQLSDLPNPGMDLSYPATLAPGAIMNISAGGPKNGNFEVNGLPSVGNDFTIDGLDANEPFLNTNRTGATGLQLGLNAVQEVTVNTEAYAVDQGRLAASAVNYVTKSGRDSFHGNLYEVWNGSALNTTNYFIKANPAHPPKPRSNVNMFGASLGGPVVHNKVFFFVDLEAARLVIPSVLTSVLPTPPYQRYVLQQLPLGGTDDIFGVPLPPQPAEVPLYQKMFSVMGDTSQGVPLAMVDCPFDVGGGPPAVPNDGTGCANQRLFSVSPVTSETLFTTKFDYNYNINNSFWIRFQLDNGTARIPDPVSSLFDQVTPSPMRSSAAGWTHIFSPRLVNQFNPGFSYASPIQNQPDPTKALAAIPMTYIAGGFTQFGGNQYINPAGLATTIWQLNDNLVWTSGRHLLKLGTNFRRVLFTTFNSSFVVPEVLSCDLVEFQFGAACGAVRTFTKSIEDRIASANLDIYAMDTFNATRKLTLSYGVRVAWNSDPISENHDIARLKGTFDGMSHDVNVPLNQDILTNQSKVYAATPLLQWEPRVAIAYELRPRTVVRAGFGIFGQTVDGLPLTVIASNPPSRQEFTTGLVVDEPGIAIFPGVPNNVVDAAAGLNQQFQAGFSAGALSCASPIASPNNCIPPLGFSESATSHFPYFMQWSSGIEQQVGQSFALTTKYAGSRSVNVFYSDGLNEYQTACNGCFSPLPFGSATDPRFSGVDSIRTGDTGSYNALQVISANRLTHGVAFQFNYTYSHCIDTSSNGGNLVFNVNGGTSPLGGQQRLHGNCDYDVRHSLNGSYSYEFPFHSRQAWLHQVVDGWQASGTVFLRDGLPFSVYSPSANVYDLISNGGPILYASAIPGKNLYAKVPINGVTLPGTIQWLNPDAFQAVIDTSTYTCFPTNDPQNCKDGTLARNSLRGPGFKWFDFAISKSFKLTERVLFKFDAQFYNVFNHPNFGFPNGGSPTAGIPGNPATLSNFGTIDNTVSPSTGLLGAGLGGDTSVRMIAIRGRIEF